MNALTPGKPKPGGQRKAPAKEANPQPSGKSGVRLTMEVDDVPLDQLPDGGMDPAQFDRRSATEHAHGNSGHGSAGNADATADPGADTGTNERGQRARGAVRSDQPTARQYDDQPSEKRAAAGSQSDNRAEAGTNPDDEAMDSGDAWDPQSAGGQDHRTAGKPAQAAADRPDDEGWAYAEPTPPPPGQRGGGADRSRPTQAGPGASAATNAHTQARVPGRLSAISVTLSVELGRQQVALGALMASTPGQLFTLDRLTSEPVDVMVNGQLFARGEVVMIGDQFGVRLTELVEPEA